MEIFKRIRGFDGYYVSSHGRVLSKKSGKQRFLKLRNYRSGHLYVALNKDGGRHNFRVHDLVQEAFVGPCPENMECKHLDGNPENNRVDNLTWNPCKRRPKGHPVLAMIGCFIALIFLGGCSFVAIGALGFLVNSCTEYCDKLPLDPPRNTIPRDSVDEDIRRGLDAIRRKGHTVTDQKGREWSLRKTTSPELLDELDDISDITSTPGGREAARRLLREEGLSEADIEHGLKALDEWKKKR